MSNPEYALLPYQRRWIADTSRIKLCLKGRRVGITWATAVDFVLDAASGKCDCYYMSVTKDLAEEFIDTAKKWCESLGLLEEADEDTYWVNEDGDQIEPALDKTGVQVFRLKFKSGKRITALPSVPRVLRGREGRLCIDEGTNQDDLPGLMKAGTAFLMWGKGSRIELISTADMESNPFMEMCAAVEKKEGVYASYGYHKVTFDDAIQDGLYRRICLINGQEWTPEQETDWRQTIVDEHGVAADSELFCRPITAEGAGWFARKNIPLIDSIRDIGFRPPEVKRAVRFWDLAATKPSPVNPDPDWTRGVRVLELSDGNYLIDDVVGCREGPGYVEGFMVETAHEDGRQVEVGTWGDPGAAGKADVETKGRALTGYVFHSPRASKSKTEFAKVWANLILQGRVYMLKREWTEDLLRELERFPMGSHDDTVDACSGAFQVLVGESAWAATWAKAWKGAVP